VPVGLNDSSLSHTLVNPGTFILYVGVAGNLGLSVVTDDLGIRVIFPQLTTETRQNLVKVLKEKLEEQKITVRRERERIWDDVQAKQKEGKLTEDEKFKAKEELGNQLQIMTVMLF